MITTAVSALLDAAWPYLAMFASAFISATLLPFASEAVLVAGLKSGIASASGLLVAATAGNVGGSLLNWWMGLGIRHFEGRRWFPFKAEDIARAGDRFNRYGVWVLLLSWLPVVGDPLTLVAGVMRVPLWIFMLLVTVGKAARYLVVAYFASWI